MNSDPNRDCEQCTESKLGRVHSAHTHGPGCTRTTLRPCAQRCVAARTRSCHASCRNAPGRVTASCHHPPVTIQKLYRDPNLCHAHCALCRARCRAYRSAPAPYRRALGAISQPCHDTRPPLCHNTKFVSRLTPIGQAMRAHVAARPAGRLALSQGLLAVSQGRFAKLLAVSWPPATRPCALVSRYNLLYRDPAQIENGQ